MIKTITKVGNSRGIIFDAAVMELTHLQEGDVVNLEIHAGGTITITPLNPRPNPVEVTALIKSTMKKYARTMKRLA